MHPDANINNPNKDQYEEKFKEIQQAYQTIMKMKNGGSNTSEIMAMEIKVDMLAIAMRLWKQLW
ncbi:MAG: hypothetical protein ACLR3X_02465 [Intestinibacter bartlettii]